MTSVPRLFPGGTVLCIASGPSLTVEDVEYCRGKVDGTIVTNDGYLIAPWADALVAADVRWWRHHAKGVAAFKGLKYTTSRHVRVPGVQVLRNTGGKGLELDPTGLRHGLNSGYRSINVAVHFGAKTIILLGFDCKRGEGKDRKEHWHGDHPWMSRSPYDSFKRYFQTLVEPLDQLGVRVINCTPGSALTMFEMSDLREVVGDVKSRAAS